MLVFGAVLVLMMVFKPGGLIENVRKTYHYKGHGHSTAEEI
jgi:branched-chain amino acid transport system permease protein